MEDAGLIPKSGRSPGEGNGNPLQYSCLENPIDRGAWRATVHLRGHKKSDTAEYTHTHTVILEKMAKINDLKSHLKKQDEEE